MKLSTRSRWMIIATICLAILGGWRWYVIEDAWARMERRVQDLRKELAVGDGSRAVPWGDSEPGNAVDDYAAALGALTRLFPEWYVEGEFPEQYQEVEAGLDIGFFVPGPVSEQQWNFVRRLQPAIDLVRRGTHRRRYRRRWNGGIGQKMLFPLIVRVPDLARVLGLRARRYLDLDRDVEFAHCYLDLMQLARDLFEDRDITTGFVGGSLISEAANLYFYHIDESEETEHAPVIALADLRPEALRVLRDGLALLDRPPQALATWIQEYLVAFETEHRTKPMVDAVIPMWQYGFSGCMMCAEALRELDEAAQRVQGITGPWQAARTDYAEVSAAIDGSHNPLIFLYGVEVLGSATAIRETTVAVRVLRMVIAEALGENTEFDDPFGDRLRKKTVGGRTRYWSVGANGSDDGGDPKLDIVFER